VTFDLATGATSGVVTSGMTHVASDAVQFTDGWWRLRLTATLTVGAAPDDRMVPWIGLANASGSAGRSFTASGSGIYIWGAQLEAGSGASSYIPTGASTATRNADSCEMSNITALNYSTQTGSVYWRGIINKQPTSYITLIGFMTAADQPTYETFGNALNFFTAARGPSLSIGGPNEVSRAYTLGSLIRYASSINTVVDPIVRVNLNGSAGSINKTGSGDLHAATRFVIGRQPSSTYGPNYPSVTIAQIKYWPTAKTASELNALIT